MSNSRFLRHTGVIIPSVNRVFESDIREFGYDQLHVHIARWRTGKSHRESNAAMADLPDIVRSVADVSPMIIAFACTAGSASGGRNAEASIVAMIEELTGIPAITTAGALARACHAAKVERTLFVTPFDHDYAVPEVEGLGDIGVPVHRVSCWDKVSARDCDGTGTDEIVARVIAADAGDIDSIVISCANVRGLEVAEELARLTGKFVTSSNLAVLNELAGLYVASK